MVPLRERGNFMAIVLQKSTLQKLDEDIDEIHTNLLVLPKYHIHGIDTEFLYIYWEDLTMLKGSFQVSITDIEERLNDQERCSKLEVHQVVISLTRQLILAATIPWLALYWSKRKLPEEKNALKPKNSTYKLCAVPIDVNHPRPKVRLGYWKIPGNTRYIRSDVH